MNYIDIVFIVIILATIIAGYSKGFVLSLISFARYIIGFPAAFFVADKYNALVYSSVVRSAALQEIQSSIADYADTDTYIGAIREAVDNLPLGLSGIIDLSFLNNISQASVAEAIVDHIVEPIALVVIKIILFVLTIALFYVITCVAAVLIKKAETIKHMPFKKTNRFLGALFGVFKAAAAVAVLSAVLVFVKDFIFASSQNEFVDQVNSSALIEFINKINPFINLI